MGTRGRGRPSTVKPTPNAKRLQTITSGEGAPHEVGGKGEGGRPAAKDRGKPTTVGGTGGGQVVDHRVQSRAGGLAAGWGVGNPVLHELAPGSGA